MATASGPDAALLGPLPATLPATAVTPAPGATRTVPSAGPTTGQRTLADELRRQGHAVSHRLVGELIHDMGHSLQPNRRMLQYATHPDRDVRFRHIDAAIQFRLALGEPVISVDTRKKELVGPFRNDGREWRTGGDAGAYWCTTSRSTTPTTVA